MSTNVQDICNDGIHACGRLTSIVGIAVLASYLVAALSPQWSHTDSLAIGGGLEAVNDAYFGLRGYCLKTPAMNLETDDPDGFYTCFDYDQTLSILSPSDPANAASPMVWNNATGCDRFGDVCKRMSYVTLTMIGALLFTIAGAIFSEKVAFFGGMLALASIFGIVSMSFWFDWLETVDGEFSAELGVGFLLTGWILGFVGTATACLNMKFTAGEDRPGICSDGINMFGRLGSTMTVLCWGMIVTAMCMTSWTSVNELGVVGGLCNDRIPTAACAGNKATFALFQFCVTSPIRLNNGLSSEEVCMTYTEAITVIGTNKTMDPMERFADYDLKWTLNITQLCSFGAILFAMLADMFSEKLFPGAVLCLLSSMCSAAVIGVWITFQNALDADVPSGADSSDGVFLVVAAFLIGLTAMVFYCVDGCKARSADKMDSSDA